MFTDFLKAEMESTAGIYSKLDDQSHAIEKDLKKNPRDGDQVGMKLSMFKPLPAIPADDHANDFNSYKRKLVRETGTGTRPNIQTERPDQLVEGYPIIEPSADDFLGVSDMCYAEEAHIEKASCEPDLIEF
jgi:hypothetical protein